MTKIFADDIRRQNDLKPNANRLRSRASHAAAQIRAAAMR
jgi:hypothetical protein